MSFGTLRRHSAGKMHQRAWLQEKVEDSSNPKDDRGHPVYEWANVGDERIPIAIKRLAGSELDRARQLQATATHRIDCRFMPDPDDPSMPIVKREMRFLFGSRELFIGDVEDVEEQHRFLVIICEERS
ncbi:MAG: phage head closure protein [Planctomycetota bacterium]